MRRTFLSLTLLISFVSLCYAGDEQVTITTYYPAPYGVYQEMRVNQMAVGNTYRASSLNDGTLIVSDRVGIGTTSPGSYGGQQSRLDVNGYAAANDVWLKNAGKWASEDATYQTFSASAFSVSCPSGWTMTGGGCWCLDASDSDDSSGHGGRPLGNGWECMSTSGAGCSGGITTYVRCVQ